MNVIMFEENSYEPLAEIYLSLIGQPSLDDIYCLCSRVFVDGAKEEEEEVEKALDVDEEVLQEAVLSAHSVEGTVRFCNFSTEPHPLNCLKKSHEEVVSCYCSASHYSTDEHDSSRDVSTLHHSDSGADLSESSRDLDWERYWTINGERLIWESWISKYGSYIDPSYLSGTDGNTNNQQPAEGEETSFCVESENISDPNQKISFSGLLSDLVTKNEQKTEPKTENQIRLLEKLVENNSVPQILVQNTKHSDDSFSRRLSDISDTGKSQSGRSEDSLSLEDNEKLQINTNSRCSGSSVVLSATTDSMTNVTRITLSSSESSYGVDNSSGKSSSILSSSDSGNSVDQQWQNLWAEHFNEQYFYHYKEFTARLSKKNDTAKVKNDVNISIYENKPPIIYNGVQSNHIPNFELAHHQESIDEVGSIETQDSVSQESDEAKPTSVNEKYKSRFEVEKLKSESKSKQQLLSVGYLLQQLKEMSVESGERSQEGDESINSLSRPSTVEDVKSVTCSDCLDPPTEELCENEHNKNDQALITVTNTIETNSIQIDSFYPHCSGVHSFVNESSNFAHDIRSNLGMGDQQENLKTECNVDSENKESSNTDQETCISKRHGIKRSHETESDESSVEKIKSAYQLMGLKYNLENTSKIRKASILYKKRFSQIRFQNRLLRLQKPLPNKHIHFDDDEEACTAHQSTDADNNDVQDKNSSSELFEDANEDLLMINQRKLEMEDFSEKDDSTDDDHDIFFSAEEDNLLDNCHTRRDNSNRNKGFPKRRKKRQSKKFVVNYPEEMIANPKIKKFWRRRYSLFSKFDEGIKMDAESWYSVTPEKIAINIAERCQCDVIVDAFCGAGGNAIQLAFTCERVIAIDIDPHKIEIARHNAKVYGVEDRIDFITGDYLQLAPTLVADVVFLSPPWGGVGYNKTGVFSLSSLLPVSGQELLKMTAKITENIGFYLPRNVNTQELVECAGPGGGVEVVQNFLDRELIAVTAYFGELVNYVE